MMYQNSYQPQYNQFSGYPQQYPQQQSMFQQNNITGRFVQNAEQIGVNDVPMNGTYSIFPKNDMTEIYAKAWDGNGNIQTLTYRLVQDDGTERAEVPTVQEQLQSFRDEIMKRFDKLENPRRSRMEVCTDE